MAIIIIITIITITTTTITMVVTSERYNHSYCAVRHVCLLSLCYLSDESWRENVAAHDDRTEEHVGHGRLRGARRVARALQEEVEALPVAEVHP